MRGCQTHLSSEGIYLPDTTKLASNQIVPAANERLTISDRWVVFARKRSDGFLLQDIENLKASVEKAVEEGTIPNPAATLVTGPVASNRSSEWGNLPSSVGGLVDDSSDAQAPEEEFDLFFPKPFNDEQMQIVRRLKQSDGVVVQGPPGTGKTHTISNIICHAMATGQRVLVVSHGEPALAVLRNQLPEGVRDLAISITTTEREGLKHLENAVRILQSVVENVHEGDQRRLIRDTESNIVGLRNRLQDVDQEIAAIAFNQMSPGVGGKRPAEIAEWVTSLAGNFDWFMDRPKSTSSDLGIDDQSVAKLGEARVRLGALLQHLDATLPSIEDLPTGATIAQWHQDLLRAQTMRDQSTGVRLKSLAGIDSALEVASSLNSLNLIFVRTRSKPWLKDLMDRSIGAGGHDPVFEIIQRFAVDAYPIATERQRYVTTPVDLPETLNWADALTIEIVTKLASGNKVFGLLSYKERALKPSFDAIRIEGRYPGNVDDWALVSDYLAWRRRMDQMSARWKALAEEIPGPPINSIRDFVALIFDLFAAFVDAPKILSNVSASLELVLTENASSAMMWEDERFLFLTEQALRNSVAAAKLDTVRSTIANLEKRFDASSENLGMMAREFLTLQLGSSEFEAEELCIWWDELRDRIDHLRQFEDDFRLVSDITGKLKDAGAPNWGLRLRTEIVEGSVDTLTPSNWRDIWDWGCANGFLRSIDDKVRLRSLSEERVRLDTELRKKFEYLVRDRTFYELGRSMNGPVRGALMMFATALRKVGSGKGKGAARHRRDAQIAMSACYSAIPCWIMPAWRVAEQLPGEVGTFDLVIMDEASQSDIRDLPALLRGKKILVVGDDKQVSPTEAFIADTKKDMLEFNYLRDQPFKTLLLPGSSLYDLAKVMFPDKLVMLKEHFRCVEPIIRFSMGFYPEPLIPLRVPTAHERLNPPLIDIYVSDGRRTGDKQNRREAEVIVEEIRRIVDDPALARIETEDRWRTIGVVSMIGAKQAALVNRLILEDLGEELVKRHRIACGDSATFQGNERDIVFLSMVADSANKISQTSTQYEQRFNVAMSRARDRLVLVRSVREDELKPEDLKAKVIRHFHDPMAGARSPAGVLEDMCDSDFERQILRRLVTLGYRVTPQVGALGYRIDLVVEGASGARLAVECDGDKFHGPERWADDMRRQRILERVGWRFWRCWGSSFYLDPDGCMEDLVATLDRNGIDKSDDAQVQASYTLHKVVGQKNAANKLISPYSDLEETAEQLVIGDQVMFQYLDDLKKVSVQLTRDQTNIANGYLSIATPIGKQLLSASEDDEIEINQGERSRKILILKVDRLAKTALLRSENNLVQEIFSNVEKPLREKSVSLIASPRDFVRDQADMIETVFLMTELKAFSNSYRLEIEDNISKDGIVWVRTDDRNASVKKRLQSWGFRYKAESGWWLKP